MVYTHRRWWYWEITRCRHMRNRLNFSLPDSIDKILAMENAATRALSSHDYIRINAWMTPILPSYLRSTCLHICIIIYVYRIYVSVFLGFAHKFKVDIKRVYGTCWRHCRTQRDRTNIYDFFSRIFRFNIIGARSERRHRRKAISFPPRSAFRLDSKGIYALSIYLK